MNNSPVTSSSSCTKCSCFFSLDMIYEQTTPFTPVVFILSPGSDPTADLMKLADRCGFGGGKFKYLSLGQGQEGVSSELSRLFTYIYTLLIRQMNIALLPTRNSQPFKEYTIYHPPRRNKMRTNGQTCHFFRDNYVVWRAKQITYACGIIYRIQKNRSAMCQFAILFIFEYL